MARGTWKARGRRTGKEKGERKGGRVGWKSAQCSGGGIYWSSPRKIAQVFLPHCNGFSFRITTSLQDTPYTAYSRDTFVLDATASAATRCSRVILGIREWRGGGKKGFSRFRVFTFLNSCVNNGIWTIYFLGYRIYIWCSTELFFTNKSRWNFTARTRGISHVQGEIREIY